jgi:hypothetical protein
MALKLPLKAHWYQGIFDVIGWTPLELGKEEPSDELNSCFAFGPVIMARTKIIDKDVNMTQ